MNNAAVPKHVAIIMDGNRRWAKNKNKRASEGHKAGAKNLEKLCLHIFERGIKYLSVFAFSTENFKRDPEEVAYLMELLVSYLNKNFKKIIDRDVKVVVSGRREGLSEEVKKAIFDIEEKSKYAKSGVFNICINYGGQQEIVDASKKIAELYARDQLDLADINEKNFLNYLYYDLPEIDYLIRTSGEIRISNFMIYQLAYSEMYFVDKYFPDFDEKEFDLALEYYANRNRRFGGN